jgi:hypothetical protein
MYVINYGKLDYLYAVISKYVCLSMNGLSEKKMYIKSRQCMYATVPNARPTLKNRRKLAIVSVLLAGGR